MNANFLYLRPFFTDFMIQDHVFLLFNEVFQGQTTEIRDAISGYLCILTMTKTTKSEKRTIC